LCNTTKFFPIVLESNSVSFGIETHEVINAIVIENKLNRDFTVLGFSFGN
jgi:hypothetical protein